MNNDVPGFIKRVRQLLCEDKCIFEQRIYGDGRDYLTVLLEDFNITPNEAIKHIKSLNINSYVGDRKPMYAKDNNAYVFKKFVNNELAYIKLGDRKK